jgi:CheY-like chemotaxis protein
MPSIALDRDAALRSAKILIVAADFSVRKVIRRLLLSLGLTDVHDAGDGARGLADIAALDPDVVILDGQLPGMSGIEFVRHVRSPAAFARPNVPIIMLAAHSGRWPLVESMRLGVNEFLLKPVSAQALHAGLVSALLRPRHAAM